MYRIFFAIFIIQCLSVCVKSAESKKADALLKAEKYSEEITEFIALGEGSPYRDKNYLYLCKAAKIAARQGEYEKALEIAEKIRNNPLSLVCKMEIMLSEKKYAEIIAKFKDEDIAYWQENAVAKGFYYRGIAYLELKEFDKAVADLKMGSEYGMPATRSLSMMKLGELYIKGFKDEEKAAEIYRRLAAEGEQYNWVTGIGLRSAVPLLAKQEKYSEAKKLLAKYDTIDMNGFWDASVLGLYAIIYESEGDLVKALATYQKALEVEGIPANYKTRYKSDIARLEKLLADKEEKKDIPEEKVEQ